jgi:glycosyltransferase involved in cell wall biosynthesis
VSRVLHSFERPAGYDLRPASPPAAAPVAAGDTRQLNVVMAGPGLSVMGGVSAVERLILAELPEHIRADHITTMVDGGNARKLWTFAQALWRYRSVLARQPDLIHIHFASGASSVRKEMLASIAQRRGVKVIMHAHGGAYRSYWEKMNPNRRARALATFKQASAIVVLGEAWREFFLSIGIAADRIVVMPNPVRLPAVVTKPADAIKVTCAYLGIISARKGAFDLVDAAALLPQSCRDRLRLVLAGNGKIDLLRERVSQRGLTGCVEVADWLDAGQRDALLTTADIFALPSYFEGLPMALLEAMAFGAVPVSTPVGSIGEVVRHEQNGLLVAPGDIAALSASLQRLIEQPEERAALAARARSTVEPFGVDVYVERLCQLYRAVARGEVPGAVA